MILAFLVGCALRRRELAALEIEIIQLRESRWVLAHLLGNGRRVRTVAVPFWVKQENNGWMTAASIEEGRLLRSIRKGGGVGAGLSDWAVWGCGPAVGQTDRDRTVRRPHLRRTCAKLCRKAGGDLEQIKFLLGRSSIQTTERDLGQSRRSSWR